MTQLTRSTRLFLFTRKYSSGWTLIEIGVVLVIVGILASMAFPLLMGAKARMDTRAEFSAMKQAFQQAQRNAVKMGKECRFIMDTTSNPPRLQLDPDPKYVGCLPFQELPLDNSNFYENFPGTAIRFSYKGNSTNMGTMVVQSSFSPTASYCLVMSGMIGMMRFGIYQADPDTVMDPIQCKTGH